MRLFNMAPHVLVSFQLCLVFLSLLSVNVGANLLVGRGIADMTGLASEGALYGYANPAQKARGLHLRQYSRAFVFHSGDQRAAFVVVESTMISQALHKQVIENLKNELGDIYTEANVMLSPTHSHSAPGGYHTYWMYQFVTLGFIEETFNAAVNGITQSIVRAHNNLKPATLHVNSGDLLGASENRSPYSYFQNPAEELSRYEYDTDKEMTLLTIRDLSDQATLGVISFFAVHTTSMKPYNHLVSTDNKGYATQMMERYLNPGKLPGKGDILVAFTQLAEGDASPNTDGSRCEITNEFCSAVTSTCSGNPNDPRKCTGRGPAGEQFKDVQIIGDKQFQKAKELFENTQSNELRHEIDYRMQWVNMSDVTVLDENNEQVKTCRPAMGYSFAAGATDGPGQPPFHQSMLQSLDRIDQLVGRVYNKTEELIACHAPKPILLPTGELEKPWAWQPEIVPVQLLRIGDLVLVGVPAEVTTMSGRRLQTAIKQALVDNGYPNEVKVLIISMANSYASYLTTFEEYQVQRYEGASTIFGPNTLKAYTKVFSDLAAAMATGSSVERGAAPPDLRNNLRDALRKIRRDDTPSGKSYGDLLIDVEPEYSPGDTVSATFVAGNPRNDLMTDKTFLEVQRKVGVAQWEVEATDASWETKFLYETSCDGDDAESEEKRCTRLTLAQTSNATITWDVPDNQSEGTYRLVHYGNARRTATRVVSYTGISSEFQIFARSRKYFD